MNTIDIENKEFNVYDTPYEKESIDNLLPDELLEKIFIDYLSNQKIGQMDSCQAIALVNHRWRQLAISAARIVELKPTSTLMRIIGISRDHSVERQSRVISNQEELSKQEESPSLLNMPSHSLGPIAAIKESVVESIKTISNELLKLNIEQEDRLREQVSQHSDYHHSFLGLLELATMYSSSTQAGAAKITQKERGIQRVSYDDPRVKTVNLLNLYCKDLAARGHFKKAFEIYDKIEAYGSSGQACLSILKKLSKNKYTINKAINRANSTINNINRECAFRSISMGLAKQGRFELALKCVENRITDRKAKDEAIAYICIKLIKKGYIDKAKELLKKIASTSDINYVLSSLAESEANRNNLEGALQAIFTISSEETRDWTFVNIVYTLISKKSFDKALGVARAISNPVTASKAFFKISEALRDNDIKRAIDIAEEISDEYWKGRAFCALAEFSLKRNQTDDAQKFIEKAIDISDNVDDISDDVDEDFSGLRDKLFFEICQHLINQGAINQVLKLANKIEGLELQDKLRSSTVAYLKKVESIEKLIEIGCAISPSTDKSDFLTEKSLGHISYRLAEKGAIREALMVSHKIINNKRKREKIRSAILDVIERNEEAINQMEKAFSNKQSEEKESQSPPAKKRNIENN